MPRFLAHTMPFRGLLPRSLRICGLVRQTVTVGMPILVVVLALVFFGTRRSVENVVNSAAASNSLIQAHSIAFALGQTLFETRNQLLILAAGSKDKQEMVERMQFRSRVPDMRYREVAFVGIDPKDRYLLLSYNGEIFDVDPIKVAGLPNSPFTTTGRTLRPGEVTISAPTEIAYPILMTADGVKNPMPFQVIRFSTPIFREDTFEGILTLSIDLRTLRHTITTFITEAEESEGVDKGLMRVVFIDSDGWMIFQGETDPDDALPLRLDDVRAGFRGDFGRAGFGGAFRPRPDYYGYWTMMNEIQQAHTGQLRGNDQEGWSDGSIPVETVSYAPVTYQDMTKDTTVVIGCIAVLDASFIISQTGAWLSGIYCLAGACAVLLFGLIFYYMARVLSAQVNGLCAEVAQAGQQSVVEPLPAADEVRELSGLRAAINLLLERLRTLEQDRDMADSLTVNQMRLERVETLPLAYEAPADGIMGESPAMVVLRQAIAQASAVNVDVLVVGETGTGKELVSRAIHAQSARRNGPFITINCGALDEGLLMDTLFGHVKGAYTEARQPRKGAFLAAEGGTLMLDEVGTASPRVQQALLRALSDRCIQPLGSDELIHFDTRVIAATNADLKSDVREGKFREDLFFRLAVITIHTPALREHKMDIPYLIVAFMKEGRGDLDVRLPDVSRGVMSQLMHYHWPGNVRELRNCVLRAMAFCEGDLILPHHLAMGSHTMDAHLQEKEPGTPLLPVKAEAVSPETITQACEIPEAARIDETARKAAAPATPPAPEAQAAKAAQQPPKPQEPGPTNPFNHRITRTLPDITIRTMLTRQEYQELVGGGISARTAQYDLQLLVEAGILRKEGRGPSMRYVVTKWENI